MADQLPFTRCAICMGKFDVKPMHLSFGVVVHLCGDHSDIDYVRKDGGRVMARRLTEVWTSNGVLTKSRVKTLAAHIRRVRDTMMARELPGSHAWKRERLEAEQRFAAGEPLKSVISAIKDPARWGDHASPSIRTIRRWYADGRWLAPQTPVHPKFAAVGKAAMQALRIAYEIGTVHSWHEWISIHGEEPRGRRRFRQNLQR